MKNLYWAPAVTLLLAALIGLSEAGWKGGPFRQMFPKHDDLNIPKDQYGDAGKPLFLTPYIEAGKIKEARQLSRVSLGHRYGHSFSGFFTVNKKYNSNLFFWFFPAKRSPDSAPVVVWLQGGPGGSSLFGLFAENGPFRVDASHHVIPRNNTWVTDHNMLYIDNPVGTGFSFTDVAAGYARNQTDVGRDLYAAVLQFFKLFPELQHNDFFVTGESYAGKYVPALTYTIHKANPSAKVKINLSGMAIGDGLCDPISMTDYGDFLYYIGLIDEVDRDFFKKQSDLVIKYIQQKQWLKAFEVFDALLNGDETGHASYFTNVTGFKYYYNYLYTDEPKDMGYYPDYINKLTVRRSIHVGNLTFHSGIKVEEHLLEDIMKSVKPWIEEILDNYRVMFYNGQLDVIIAYTLTENFLHGTSWKYAEQYRDSSRLIWRIDGEVAGYVREVPNFAQVMIRNSGHMVPYDQPKWAHDMITHFTRMKSFFNK